MQTGRGLQNRKVVGQLVEKNEYNPLNLTKHEEIQKGSYSISFLPVTKKELRIDYWTGAFLAAALIYQIATGILLAYYYEPGSPYTSTLMIMGTVPFGEVLLTSHLFMAYAMVASYTDCEVPSSDHTGSRDTYRISDQMTASWLKRTNTIL